MTEGERIEKKAVRPRRVRGGEEELRRKRWSEKYKRFEAEWSWRRAKRGGRKTRRREGPGRDNSS